MSWRRTEGTVARHQRRFEKLGKSHIDGVVGELRRGVFDMTRDQIEQLLYGPPEQQRLAAAVASTRISPIGKATAA